MRIAAASVAVLAAVTLAACSSTSNGTPTSAPSSKTTPSTSGPTGFPSTSTTASTPTSGGLTQTQAQAALLTAAEVGKGFAQTPSDDIDTALPCTPNQPPLSQQFPPDVKVQTDFGGAGGKAVFSEEIEGFADADTVDQVIAAGEKGLACRSATISGTKVAITGPTELTAQIPVEVDEAEAWSVTSSVLNAALVIVKLDNTLVVFSFSGDPSVDDSKLPDPPTLILTGLRKVKAALK